MSVKYQFLVSFCSTATHLRRSPRLNGLRRLAASLAISSSPTFVPGETLSQFRPTEAVEY